MKHPAEQKHFYRTAAAAAVIAAIASLSAPVWAVTTEVANVTSSIPGDSEIAPETLVITGSGTFTSDSETGAVTVTGKPNVYLTGNDQTIAIRATESVTIGDPDDIPDSAVSGPVLIASSDALSFSSDEADALGASMFNGWPFTAVTGAPDGGSIDIESGVKGGTGGSITLGGGAVLIANAPDAKNPLTFTVNGDKNASQMVIASDIVTFGPGAKSDITLTGEDSSFTGYVSASQGGKAVLNSIGTPVETDEEPTTVMAGTVSADHGGSVTVTASDTLDQNVYTALNGGNITVSLTGNSIQETIQKGQMSRLISMAAGPGSSFKETTASGVSVSGGFEGLGGSHSEISLGGSWDGDAFLTSILPTLETTVDEESGDSVIQMVPTAAASDMSITVNGAWSGDAQVMNTVYNAPGVDTESFEPEQATLSVTANGGWTGYARVIGEKSRLNVTIAEKQAEGDSFPVSIWKGNAQVSDHGTANVIVNDEWIGGATVSYTADDDNNQAVPPRIP